MAATRILTASLPSSSSDPAFNATKKHEKEQIRMRDLWDKSIQNHTKYVHYKATVVLMLYWKDSDLNKSELDKELVDLSKVFHDHYGFTVKEHVLDSKDHPRRRLNRCLADFVDKFDEEETLLILYYAGHGWDTQNQSHRRHKYGQSEFMLADKATVNAAQIDKALVAWRSAEHILLSAGNADILAIFDCCEAGSLASTRGPRRFEYLGACLRGDSTKPAGRESFTRALIWALKELKDEKGSWFSTSKLRYKIRDAPDFPHDQTPSLGSRFIQDDYIVISPAPHKLTDRAQKDRETQQQGRKPVSVFLDLKFRFEGILDDDTIRHTAQALRRLMGSNKIKATEITFIEKQERIDARLRNLVRKVMQIRSEGRFDVTNKASLKCTKLLQVPCVQDALVTPWSTLPSTPDQFESSAHETVPLYTADGEQGSQETAQLTCPSSKRKRNTESEDTQPRRRHRSRSRVSVA